MPAAQLAGRTAVVTGAASGIGLAIARELGSRGAHVELVDRDHDRLAHAVESLTGLSVVARQHDVTERGAIAELLREISGRQSLDFVFNNAGVGGTLSFDSATAEQWDKIIALNLRAVIDGTSAAYKVMAEQGHGHIVNTASVSGLVPVPMQTLYNTTKYGIVGLSLSLRPEAAARGVRVSVVCPGNVATNIFAVPIIGTPAEDPVIPADAVPADEAARIILDGVQRNRDVIVFPRVARRLIRWYRFMPRRWDRWAKSIVDQAASN
jgi:short-subunit dehydrogenase